MTPTRFFAACALPSLVASLVGHLGAQAQVHHHLAFGIGDESARVTVKVTGWRGASMVVRMPGWSEDFEPGVRHAPSRPGFALRASVAGGQAIEVTSQSTGEWSVQPRGGAVTLEYDFPLVARRHADGLGQRYPHTTKRDGKDVTVRYHETLVLRGGTTWLQITAERQRITFDLPSSFEVATGLPRDDDGSYKYSGFAPFYIGKFQVLDFAVYDKPHRAVLAGFGRDRTDRAELVDRLVRIVQANRSAMGILPYEEYTFLIGRQSSRPSSIGHANSAEVIAPSLRESRVSSLNLARAHLAAWDAVHFHPAGRDGADGSPRTLTALAWFWVGAREYLTELAVVRAGLQKPEAFWTTTAAHINKLRQDKRRLEHSVATTGARMQQPSEIPRGAPHPRLVGLLLSLLLDVEIRAGSSGRKSLHDALRDLRAQCETRRHGYTLDDIKTACERAAGHRLAALLACATTTRELPLTATLLKIGIDARPGAGKKPKPPASKHFPKSSRRRPPRWHVVPLPNPTKQALSLRTALTKSR